MPDVFEVWFVQQSIKKTVLVEGGYSSLMAQNSYQCVRVGEHCFDPQIGLYDPQKLEKSGEIEIPEAIFDEEWQELEKNSRNYEDLSSLDVVKKSKVQCDNTTFFDMFCGKAKGMDLKKVELEVYIDATESMGRNDSTDLKKECYRSSFVRRVLEGCKNSSVFIFNHSRKEIHNPILACESQSITDDTHLINWVKNSNAKKLIVVTDKEEVGKRFIDFAYLSQANFRGEKLGEELYLSELPNQFTRLKKTCRN